MSAEKPTFPILLSPEAVTAVRQIIFGVVVDHSPNVRDVQSALMEAGCNEVDEAAVLHLLGFADRPVHHGTPIRPIDRPRGGG